MSCGDVIARTVKAWAARHPGARRGLDLDDLMQDAALYVARYARTPSPDVAAWIAVRACRASVRRDIGHRAQDAAAALRESTRPKGRPPIDRDAAADIAEALAAIPPAHAAAVRARYLDGLTIPEAAAAIGVSRAAVERRTVAGLAALRVAIGPSYGDEWSRAVPLRDPSKYKIAARRPGGKSVLRRPRPAGDTRRATDAKLAVIDAAKGAAP